LCAAILGVQLRDFEGCEGLPGMDTVANIDIDVPDIPRYLGVHVYYLICLELPGQTQ
jgi:hypothetical protein